jgi:hypothetical protein
MPQASDQEMPAVGEMSSQEGNAVASRSEALLRLRVAQPVETVEEQIGVEVVQRSQGSNL